MNQLVLFNFYSIIVFTLIYFTLTRSDGDTHFEGLNASSSIIDVLYFSTSVQSTVGFGDVFPKTKVAKIIVTLQQLFIITTLVSLKK